MITILDIITIASATIIVTESDIFKPFREWMSKKNKFFGNLFSCSLCSGVWIGGLYFFIPQEIFVDLDFINIKLIFTIFVRDIISYAAIGGLSSRIVSLIINRLKIK